ncbi:transposase domain-containing protein, partial [Ralstonia pseudosolanacearum]|uniref:transposase domain-containing protein n=1 Tax=Ralstonia pseudosolanacearum TaxID=1310165 RepID=UPI003CE8CFB0
ALESDVGAVLTRAATVRKDALKRPLTNNPCENAIRPFVVGRRNWLFCDTVAGANASANLYSLVETAKASGVDPYQYLVAALKLLPKAQTADDYEALLPWNLTSAQS